jgi:hypothetical protein
MILKRTSFAIALAVLVLGMAAGLQYAQRLDLVGSDAARRVMQVTIGLMLAAYSNLMPKDVGPWRSSALAVARSQSALRVGGWSMTLASLACRRGVDGHRRLGAPDHDGIWCVDAAGLPLGQTTASRCRRTCMKA